MFFHGGGGLSVMFVDTESLLPPPSFFPPLQMTAVLMINFCFLN